MKKIALIVIGGIVLAASVFVAGMRVQCACDGPTWSVTKAEQSAEYRDMIRLELKLIDYGEQLDADLLVLDAQQARIELRQRDAQRVLLELP